MAEVRETLRQKHEHETSDEHLEELMEEAAESGSMKALERVWRCCWLRSQGAFYRAWSRTEQHQARELIDQLEDPDLAVELIRAAVEQWSACTTAVKRDAALREAPARPAVGWLLRYRTDVWAWFASREEAGGARRGTTVAEAIESGEL